MNNVPDNTFNIYCDESCHLEGDNIPVMVLGGVMARAGHVERISEAIRSVKVRHGLSKSFETKWTKISPAKLNYYLELVDLFLEEDVTARVLVVPNKALLDHGKFEQSHDDWYYKMYYTLLKTLFRQGNTYRIYLDIKDTRGAPKTRKLHEVICNSRWDFDGQYVQCVQQIRSHESELLQLVDLIIGAVAYANRGLEGSPAKRAIIEHLSEKLGKDALTTTSYLSTRKLNVLIWEARK